VTPALAALVAVLREPASLAQRAPADQDLLVRQVARAGLLGTLARRFGGAELPSGIVGPVRWRLRAAATLATEQQRALGWELREIARALEALEGPVLLLKGAAYAALGLPVAAGRLFSDVDLLVARAQLADAEAGLMIAGWQSAHHDAYDQRYYRQWMHELPPLQHVRRSTVVDLHHGILPPTARLHPRTEPILERSQPVPGWPRFRAPGATDLVLHSATHLFHEGDWEQGLRGLVDIDALLRPLGVAPGFWDALRLHAAEQQLGRPLYYALALAQRILETPLPVAYLDALPQRPMKLHARAMLAVFGHALGAAHWSLRSPGTAVAGQLLYVRSHWLRMPLHLLIPHLARKAWRRDETEHTIDP
jgi:hypothetical protein